MKELNNKNKKNNKSAPVFVVHMNVAWFFYSLHENLLLLLVVLFLFFKFLNSFLLLLLIPIRDLLQILYEYIVPLIIRSINISND